MGVDRRKLEEFLDRALAEAGAALHAALVVVGDRLGLYRSLAAADGLTPAQLAERTGTTERYVREWLAAQTAGGYVSHDPGRGTYFLSPEQRHALADPAGPDLPGLFLLTTAVHKVEEKISDAFRTGAGFGWHEHHPLLFRATERFFRPGYSAHLVGSWIPALHDVPSRLERGAVVADVGCGHGVTTILMATAYPNSSFVGFDYHAPSIERARELADEAGVSGRVRFEVASAKEYPGTDYDLVTFFDCLHDMGDPVGAARHVLGTLRSEGTWMIVEPYAGDRLEDSLTPVGRLYYAASTMICTPASRAQEVGLALGAQAGEARLREVVTAAGFGRFRRAVQTPFNLVLEARP